jgi:hypothetical protein
VTALVAYLAATIVTGAILARPTGWFRPAGAVRPSSDLADQARKIQAVLSSLAGFAVTSIVLLISLSGNRLDVQAERSVELIVLLVVSYLGFVVGAIMYAHTEPCRTRTGVDLLPAQHALASAQFYRSITSGWLALAPLIAILGVDRLTIFVLALLFIAVPGAWIFHSANLVGLGFAESRFVVLELLAGLGGAFAFAVLVHFVPQLRSPDAVLFLVGAGAALGANAHFAFHTSRALSDMLPESVASRLRMVVSLDSHASQVLMAFTWLGIAGLI